MRVGACLCCDTGDKWKPTGGKEGCDHWGVLPNVAQETTTHEQGQA